MLIFWMIFYLNHSIMHKNLSSSNAYTKLNFPFIKVYYLCWFKCVYTIIYGSKGLASLHFPINCTNGFADLSLNTLHVGQRTPQLAVFCEDLCVYCKSFYSWYIYKEETSIYNITKYLEHISSFSYCNKDHSS